MANFVEVQSIQVAQFTTDTSLVTNAILLLANRSFNVIDYAIAVTAVAGDGGDGTESRIRIDEVTPAGVTVALGTIPTTLAAPVTLGLILRPLTTVIAAAPILANKALIANATVNRGNFLRIAASASGGADANLVRATGNLRLLPGNRYASATSTSAYFPNNSASGAQGSAAVQSI